jgi:hypothetical protein
MTIDPNLERASRILGPIGEVIEEKAAMLKLGSNGFGKSWSGGTSLYALQAVLTLLVKNGLATVRTSKWTGRRSYKIIAHTVKDERKPQEWHTVTGNKDTYTTTPPKGPIRPVVSAVPRSEVKYEPQPIPGTNQTFTPTSLKREGVKNIEREWITEKVIGNNGEPTGMTRTYSRIKRTPTIEK